MTKYIALGLCVLFSNVQTARADGFFTGQWFLDWFKKTDTKTIEQLRRPNRILGNVFESSQLSALVPARATMKPGDVYLVIGSEGDVNGEIKRNGSVRLEFIKNFLSADKKTEVEQGKGSAIISPIKFGFDEQNALAAAFPIHGIPVLFHQTGGAATNGSIAFDDVVTTTVGAAEVWGGDSGLEKWMDSESGKRLLRLMLGKKKGQLRIVTDVYYAKQTVVNLGTADATGTAVAAGASPSSVSANPNPDTKDANSKSPADTAKEANKQLVADLNSALKQMNPALVGGQGVFVQTSATSVAYSKTFDPPVGVAYQSARMLIDDKILQGEAARATPLADSIRSANKEVKAGGPKF